MGGINRFGEEDRPEWSTFADGKRDEFKEEVEHFLQYTDQQLAVACGNATDEKIRSIVNWHFQGRKLSEKQRWCLAAHCVNYSCQVVK